MYNYDFNNNKVIFESVDNLISFNDKELIVNILVTDKNILIFKNIVNPALRGREIYELPEYELFIEVDLNNLKYEIDEDNSIINWDKNELIIYNFDIKKIVF